MFLPEMLKRACWPKQDQRVSHVCEGHESVLRDRSLPRSLICSVDALRWMEHSAERSR
jgi:hypothetical protein